MSNLVIYATKKGSSEIYAKEFAKRNEYPIFEKQQMNKEELQAADRIFYFGSVYAGKVLGLELLKSKLTPDRAITIISVGLTSVNDREKLEEIREGIIKEIPQAEIFHLRGRLSSRQLKLPEKLIVKMICKTSKNKPEQAKLDIEKAIEQVVNSGSADYIDLTELKNIK